MLPSIRKYSENIYLNVRAIIEKFLIRLLRRIIIATMDQNPSNTRSRPYVDARGQFKKPPDLRIGEGTNIIVFPNSTLMIGANVYVGRYAELAATESELSIGAHTSIQDGCNILGDIHIGRYCTFAANVQVSSGNHYFDLFAPLNIKDQDALVMSDPVRRKAHSRPVIIEDDCWLGFNVWVKAGVTIGKGSVIGANAVVTKSIPPYSVAAGNPARILRKRLNFSPPDTISWNSTADLPYFYTGFMVSIDERSESAKAEGLFTLANFAIALSETAAVRMVAKYIGSGDCSIEHNRRQFAISSVWTEIRIENVDQVNSIISFSVTSDSSHDFSTEFSGLIVREVNAIS